MKRKNILLKSLFCAFIASLLLSTSASAQIYKKSECTEKQIALTFDDGPSDAYTEILLNILSEYNIKATFFVIGQNAEKDPKRIRMISEAGHEIGNHTYTHCYINRISEESLKNEIQKTEKVLEKITGKKPVVFRPPGGSYNDKSIEILENMGYKSVLWSIDTRDWSLPKTDKVVSIVQANTAAGDIILFHDLNQKNLPTPEALRRIIPFFLENGYEFKTVSELLEKEAA